MKLRVKLVSTIAAFCLVLCLTIVGVWAVSSATVSMGGNISFTATDVNATVTFNNFTGVSEKPTPATLVYNGTESTSTPSSGDVSTWSGWDLSITGKTAVLTFTVANTHAENTLKVKFKDSSALTVGTNNCSIAVTDDNAGDVTAAEGITLAVGESVQITVTITIANENKSVSNAALNFSLVLEDEHHTAA